MNNKENLSSWQCTINDKNEGLENIIARISVASQYNVKYWLGQNEWKKITP